jgi:nicotinate-nucleotide--dimethylbenzimidazole phosphoribosyltransferase
MTSQQCEQAMRSGAELVAEAYENGTNLIAFGEMGIGNTSSAALIMSRLLNLPIAECTGRGTGLDDEKLQIKTDILQKALDRHPDAQNVMEVLQCFGGFEIAMTAGAVLKAAELKMTVLVDGFIITSAVLAASELYPQVKDYLIFAHLSDEYAHGKMIQALGGKPVLCLNMRLGEGSGAAVALPVIHSAVNFLNKMASFEEAAVSGKSK